LRRRRRTQRIRYRRNVAAIPPVDGIVQPTSYATREEVVRVVVFDCLVDFVVPPPPPPVPPIPLLPILLVVGLLRRRRDDVDDASATSNAFVRRRRRRSRRNGRRRRRRRAQRGGTNDDDAIPLPPTTAGIMSPPSPSPSPERRRMPNLDIGGAAEACCLNRPFFFLWRREEACRRSRR
jgi:hypothetical protein